MKIDNPPLPPFRKGGLGGFESYFPRNLPIKRVGSKYGKDAEVALEEPFDKPD